MINITHRRDPAGIQKPVIYSVNKSVNILDWLYATFKDQDELCGGLACSFVLNGREIFRSDHENLDHSLLDVNLGFGDHLVIINRPAGLGTAAIIYIAIAVASVAASVYSYLNMPELPGESEARNESSNNKLNAATNEFRPRQGIPQCFGNGVSYPDFIQPSYYEYKNNIKTQFGLFCITEGEADISEIRIGDTNIADIANSSATVFPPGSAPFSDFLVIHQPSANVNNQTLLPPDDRSVWRDDIDVVFEPITTPNQTTLKIGNDVIKEQSLKAGGYIYLHMYHYSAGATPVKITDFQGVFEILSISTGATLSTVVINHEHPTAGVTLNGEVGRGSGDGVIGEGDKGDLDNWVGWFDTPSLEADTLMAHIVAPRGVRTKNGGELSLLIEIQAEEKTTGIVHILQETITENTLDAQFRTYIFKNKPVDQYRMRIRRLTVTQELGASDTLQLEAFVSVTPYKNHNFGDVTTILVQRSTSNTGPDQAGKKINCDYQRKLPTYNRTTGAYDLNTLTATSSFADAAAYTLIARGNETIDTVDLHGLYEISDRLSDDLKGFTFTFDDANLSKGERIESICNVARVASFHDGSQWRFSRDEEKPIRTAMFNRRSVISNNARQAWQPQRSDDADSVKVTYVDPDTNTEAFAIRSFDTVNGAIVSDVIGLIPLEIKLAGCRNKIQAENRADLEIRRIAYQRRSVMETTYRDALEIDLLDRVGWVDINDVDIFDGEILGVNGNIFDTSEGFYPENGKSYVVYITDSNGYSSNTVTCTPRSDTDFGFVANGLSGAYLADDDKQVGSRYVIADADDIAGSDFTLKSRAPTDSGTVEIELVEYKSAMYEMD